VEVEKMMTVRSASVLAALIALMLLVTGCFGALEVKFNVSGVVRDQTGAGMSGVVLGFGDRFGTAETNDSGEWNKVDLYGAVSVTPAKAGYYFVPAARVVDLSTKESVDFVGYPLPLDLELTNLSIRETKECFWPFGCDDPEYSYGIHGIVTNAGGPGEFKIEIFGMPFGVEDAPWNHVHTYGPREMGAGDTDVVISIPSSTTRYGWFKLELHGLVDSCWVLSQEVIEKVQ